MSLSLFDFLILLVIAGVCGSIGGAIAGGTRGGCLVSIALGFIGALVGMFLRRTMNLPELFELSGFPIVWSIAGSALFVAVINLLSRRQPRE
jgi:uncharacterized membrane protein YeaQ/YmgE (transglycosylase-associated protein family)